MSHPRINPVVVLSPVEEGYIAYDPVLDRLHQLNPMAALLLELSDGNRGVDEIRALVGPLVEEGKQGEIDRWVEDGLKVGLLVTEDAAAGVQELSTAELTARAKRMKEYGKVQSGYLCVKRAVEMTPDDADALYELGELSLCIGKREEARTAYQTYYDLCPDDGEIEHLLRALRDEAPPPRASDRAIQHIYKNFAASYETRMVTDLKYVGPERINDGLNAVIGDAKNLNVLDLGCGSGLAGVMIKPRAAHHLIGVDLSPEMIELSRARGIYDRLEVSEITQWLDQGDELFDLIQSVDCLIYFGDLSTIVAAAKRRLKPGAIFAMSMERGDKHPYFLTDTGRYIHHPDHVREVAAKTGMEVAYLNESFLRMEYGEDVMGLYVVLRKN